MKRKRKPRSFHLARSSVVKIHRFAKDVSEGIRSYPQVRKNSPCIVDVLAAACALGVMIITFVMGM